MLDLQTHVIDAAVDLFGPVESVYAEVFCRTTVSEDDAFLACRHESGAVSHLATSSRGRARPGPASGCSAARRRSCSTPSSATWTSTPTCAPTTTTAGGSTTGRSARPARRSDSSQVDFYRQVAAALQADDVQAAMPVDPRDAVHTLAVIDAARASAESGTAARVITPGDGPRRSRSGPARRRRVAEAQPRRRTSRRSSRALSPSRVTT